MRTALTTIALCLVTAAAPIAARAQTELNHDLYARLLVENTISTKSIMGTKVNYAALSKSADWRKLVTGLGATNPDKLVSRNDRKAYWINAYNILAIDMVVRHYPVESIKDVGSLLSPVWKKDAGKINGEMYTLDRIEHKILRKMGDPRIHAAIVCASASCPTLNRKPYRALTLEQQLNGAMRAWLGNADKGMRIDQKEGEVYLSPIFDWFSEDFTKGGKTILVALRPYMDSALGAWVDVNGADADVEYFDYDWSLNEFK